ncbi:protein FAM98B-like [Spea bombifrons]|uniref:protein FAM98B-like n=1 Tax=Spea bombifrons TaxID=233779 RepID=UPI00234B4685|nr:protein FAM98B-like [Spea bombifrons]
MEADLLDTLEALGYKGPLMDEAMLATALEAGLTSPEFLELLCWLSSQIKLLGNLEETICAEGDDIESIQLEVSGFLKELSCPYPTLVSGVLTGRLKNQVDCLKLLLFLGTELQAMLILQSKVQMDARQSDPAYLELKAICDALRLPEPSSCDVVSLLKLVEAKITEALSQVKTDHIGQTLLNVELNEEQMERLKEINTALSKEYECRRKMLIKRLDVTVQSFGWSDRAKAKTDEIARIYQPARYSLSPKTTISFSHLLAAREDLSRIVRTSSEEIRKNTACAVNKVLMGRVPDRGGRPSEINPPPPEMPPWQKRQDGGGRGGWRGRGGGGRGGYNGGGGYHGRGGYSNRGGYSDSYGGRGGHRRY